MARRLNPLVYFTLTSAVNVDEKVSLLTPVTFPAMARHLPPPGMETISSQVKAEYDANYKDGTDKWVLMGTDGKWRTSKASATDWRRSRQRQAGASWIIRASGLWSRSIKTLPWCRGWETLIIWWKQAMNFLGSWLVSIYNFDTKCYNMKNENWEMGDDNG